MGCLQSCLDCWNTVSSYTVEKREINEHRKPSEDDPRPNEEANKNRIKAKIVYNHNN